ncbi:MAG: electron transfer flavoprotein subunit beta/FixA family protein [Pseudomonadota bacterium]
MNIVVCIKQVPDTANIRIDNVRMTIIREGVESIINPVDSVALEAALDLRNKVGGRITVMSMGPPQSEEALREALAAGADQAILLTDPSFAGADTLATSHVLARAISRLEPFPDLILCGNQTVDSDTGHVGPQIAEELNLPQVCGVHEIHPEEVSLRVKRRHDSFLDIIRVSMPALLSVSQELGSLHFIPFGNLESAFTRGQVIHWGMDDLQLQPEEVGFKGSATQVWKIRRLPPKRKAEILEGPAPILVEQLIKRLESLGIIEEDSGSE